MSDALLAVGAALVVAAAVLVGLGLLTLVPFVVTLDLAERRGAGTVRWGVGSALASGLGLAVLALARSGPWAVALAGIALTWSAPVAVRALDRAGSGLTGARGRHE